MQTLTFDIVSKAWNKVKIAKLTTLKKNVPGLSDPSPIIVKRITEDDHSMVIEFKNMEKAVGSPARDIPMLKKVIMNWIRSFSSGAQIVRGEPTSLIVRLDTTLTLPGNTPKAPVKMNQQPEPAGKYEDQPEQKQRGLTNIIRKKAVA